MVVDAQFCEGRLTGVNDVPTEKQLRDARALLAGFDWSKVDALTDDEIIAAAKSDPDCSLPTDEELAEFDLVIPAKSRHSPSEKAAE